MVWLYRGLVQRNLKTGKRTTLEAFIGTFWKLFLMVHSGRLRDYVSANLCQGKNQVTYSLRHACSLPVLWGQIPRAQGGLPARPVGFALSTSKISHRGLGTAYKAYFPETILLNDPKVLRSFALAATEVQNPMRALDDLLRELICFISMLSGLKPTQSSPSRYPPEALPFTK